MKKTVNVTFNGAFVGTAEIDEESGIFELELDDNDVRILFPDDKNPSFGFADIETVDRVVPPYPQWDIDLSEVYYKNRPKGTFDA